MYGWIKGGRWSMFAGFGARGEERRREKADRSTPRKDAVFDKDAKSPMLAGEINRKAKIAAVGAVYEIIDIGIGEI